MEAAPTATGSATRLITNTMPLAGSTGQPKNPSHWIMHSTKDIFKTNQICHRNTTTTGYTNGVSSGRRLYGDKLQRTPSEALITSAGASATVGFKSTGRRADNNPNQSQDFLGFRFNS
jgi:hypothetical protein